MDDCKTIHALGEGWAGHEAPARYSGIPKKFREHPELQNVILEITDDIWEDRGKMDEPAYTQKYVDAAYRITEEKT